LAKAFVAGNPATTAWQCKMGEETDAYRIRIGDYRVIYIINDQEKIVEVVRVAHRREVYR